MTRKSLIAGEHSRWLALLLATLIMTMAGAVQAATFPMSGSWLQQRGIAAIPIGGIIVNKPGARVTMGGASSQAITVPPDAFGVPGQPFGALFPLPAPLVMLSTMFTAHGPEVQGVLKKNFGVNFAFCIGAVPMLCSDHQSTGQGAAAGQGTEHGLVRYAKGPDAFGGTMQMVLGGTGVLYKIIGSTPLLVSNAPLGAGAIGDAQAFGGSYDNIDLDELDAGPVTSSPDISGGGLITAPGPVVGTGEAVTNRNHGFPWTTGMVYVQGTDAGPGQDPTTVTITGSQNRTPNGRGQITLVTGGVTTRLGDDSTFMSTDTITMDIGHVGPALNGIATLLTGGLILAAVRYAVRRRLAAAA